MILVGFSFVQIVRVSCCKHVIVGINILISRWFLNFSKEFRKKSCLIWALKRFLQILSYIDTYLIFSRKWCYLHVHFYAPLGCITRRCELRSALDRVDDEDVGSLPPSSRPGWGSRANLEEPGQCCLEILDVGSPVQVRSDNLALLLLFHL